jgi:hypothetical protein
MTSVWARPMFAKRVHCFIALSSESALCGKEFGFRSESPDDLPARAYCRACARLAGKARREEAR